MKTIIEKKVSNKVRCARWSILLSWFLPFREVRRGITFLLLLLSLPLMAQEKINGDVSKLSDGDLLFFSPAISNAITDVTSGIDGRPIDHVAIFLRIASRPYTLEAVRRGVVLQPIDSTIVRHTRNGESIFVGRIKDSLDVAASIANALDELGKPYDFYFEPTDSAVYCSELVEHSYRQIDGQKTFDGIPMSFHDASGKVTPYWTEYYRRAGKKVPEGEQGSNPGQLSRSSRIRILYQFL